MSRYSKETIFLNIAVISFTLYVESMILNIFRFGHGKTERKPPTHSKYSTQIFLTFLSARHIGKTSSNMICKSRNRSLVLL